MRPSRLVQLRRAQAAADALVAALREHDLDGAALVRAKRVARLLQLRQTGRQGGDPASLDRALHRVRAVCEAHRLDETPAVRQALLAFTVAAEGPAEG